MSRYTCILNTLRVFNPFQLLQCRACTLLHTPLVMLYFCLTEVSSNPTELTAITEVSGKIKDISLAQGENQNSEMQKSKKLQV